MKKIILPLAVSFCCLQFNYAQPGELDPSFGINGIVTANLGPNTSLTHVATQGDGKIIVSGYTIKAKKKYDKYNYFLVRFNPDGSRDNKFHSDPLQFVPTAIAIQADDKIVAAGYAPSGNHHNSSYASAIVRYNANGRLDHSFSQDGIQYNDFAIAALAIQADGKIVVVGGIQVADDWYGHHNNFALARYNTNGSPDNSFSGDGKQTTEFMSNHETPITTANYSLAIQTDGKILMSGRELIDNFDSYGGWLVRYNIDGSVNKIKHIWIGDFGYVSSMAIGNNNEITISGNVWNPYIKFGALFTLDPNDWDSDLSYSEFTPAKVPFANYRVMVESNGKIILTGPAIVRFNADASLDDTFSGDGIQTMPGGNSVADAALTKSKLYVVGSNILARYVLEDINDKKPPPISNVTANTAKRPSTIEVENAGSFIINALPNPSSSSFTLLTKNNNKPINIKVTDVMGRVVEIKLNITTTNFEIGNNYQPGIYIVEVSRGKLKQLIKLVKQ